MIASGGISSLADLRAAAELGCVGAIVGRAIYEGRIDLAKRSSSRPPSADAPGPQPIGRWQIAANQRVETP